MSGKIWNSIIVVDLEVLVLIWLNSQAGSQYLRCQSAVKIDSGEGINYEDNWESIEESSGRSSLRLSTA